MRYLQSKLALCNETLVKIIKSDDTSDQVKINAINAIYTNVKGMIETADVLERLDELERIQRES